MIVRAMRKRLQHGVAVCYIAIPTLAVVTLVALKAQKWDGPSAFFWMMLISLAVEAVAVVAFAATLSGRIELFVSRHPAIGMALTMPKRLAVAQLLPMLLTVLGIAIGHVVR